MPAFLRALAPCFPFLAEGAGIRGSTSARVGTYPTMGHHASAFKEKPNNVREQMQ
jgi:hypothetical protein